MDVNVNRHKLKKGNALFGRSTFRNHSRDFTNKNECGTGP